MGAIVLNVAANILGLNNAATPLGLRAMSELNKLNIRPGIATNAMCMLLAINTSSITLIPVTAIGLLAFYHGKNPTVIIGTSLAATACAQLAAITTCKLLERTGWSRRQLEQAPEIAPQLSTASESTASTQGGEIERKAEESDTTLPWVPGAKWVLAGMAAFFSRWFWHSRFRSCWGGRSHLMKPRISGRCGWLTHSRCSSCLGSFCFSRSMRRCGKLPVYDEFVEGGKEGFNVILRILPYIVAMLVAVGMFRAAGGMLVITSILSPVTDLLHFPSELVPMALIRPFSSTAALALLTDLVKNPTYGPNNLITLMAATFYGCSETTFYVIAVYFGSVGVRKTRHAIPTGIVADTIGPIAAVIVCRAVLG